MSTKKGIKPAELLEIYSIGNNVVIYPYSLRLNWQINVLASVAFVILGSSSIYQINMHSRK